MKSQHFIYLVLILAVIVQSAYYYPKLPDEIASHFDINGQPDSWVPKEFLIAFDIGFVLLTSIMFMAMPLTFRIVPDSLINLPKKDYWLAPERRDETISFLSRQLSRMGMGTVLFLFFIFELILRANLQNPFHISLTPMMIILGLYLAFTMVWLICFVVHFYRTP